jgi:hypothetical protein
MQAKPNKTKLKSLDSLGFIRQDWGFSTRYSESKQFFSLARRTRSGMRQRSGLARHQPHELALSTVTFTHVETMISKFLVSRKCLF